LHDLSAEIDKPKGNLSPSMRNGIEPNNKPIPVEVRQPDLGALQMLTALLHH
jgi:hypothetical protein